jgi:hypothetical protein
MERSEVGEDVKAFSAGGFAPGEAFVEKGGGFGEVEARCVYPKGEFVKEGESVVSAVGNEEEWDVEFGMDGRKRGKASGARQREVGDVIIFPHLG